MTQEPSKALLETHSSQSLRNVESLLSCSLDEAFALVEKCPHQRLWAMLGKEALRKRQFQLAVKSFVRMNDYKTIQYIKQVGHRSCATAGCTLSATVTCNPSGHLQIERLNDSSKQDADIAAFFGQYDEAQAICEESGRLDLALQLFMRLGQVDRVEGILKVCIQQRRSRRMSSTCSSTVCCHTCYLHCRQARNGSGIKQKVMVVVQQVPSTDATLLSRMI